MNKSLIEIHNMEQMKELQNSHKSFLVVLFYTESSDRSKEVLAILSEIKQDKPDTAIAAVNASYVKNIHPNFGITSVPTVITLKKGRIVKKLEGSHQKAMYEALLMEAPRKRSDGTELPPLRAVVYRTPTCPHCNTVKSYLRKHGVPFREVDVSKDERAAREMTERSGSMGVPQTEINGKMVVGADIARLNELIGVRE